MNEINPSVTDLKRWGLEGLIRRESVMDILIEKEEKPETEEKTIIDMYLKFKGIKTKEELTKWMRNENLNDDSVRIKASRHHMWFKACEKKYKSKAASMFLREKNKLDKISYSLIWIEDELLASEVFIRVKEGECTIEEAVLMSSNPPKGLKIGKVGPVAFKNLPDGLSEVLRISQPDQIWPPIKAEGGWVIIKCEKLWPAVFNQEERINMILELGEQWLSQELQNTVIRSSAEVNDAKG